MRLRRGAGGSQRRNACLPNTSSLQGALQTRLFAFFLLTFRCQCDSPALFGKLRAWPHASSIMIPSWAPRAIAQPSVLPRIAQAVFTAFLVGLVFHVRDLASAQGRGTAGVSAVPVLAHAQARCAPLLMAPQQDTAAAALEASAAQLAQLRTSAAAVRAEIAQLQAKAAAASVVVPAASAAVPAAAAATATCLSPSRATIEAALSGELSPLPAVPFPAGTPEKVRALFSGKAGPGGFALSPFSGLTKGNWPLDLQGWNGDDPDFARIIPAVQPPVRVAVEVGSWKGQSTNTIVSALKSLPSIAGAQPPVLIAIDSWLGALEFMTRAATVYDPDRALFLAHGQPHVYLQFLTNMLHMGHEDTVVPIVQNSVLAGRFLQWAGVRAQFIYVDASHDADDVFQDMVTFFPLLDASGSVMVGDDWGWDSVKKGVTRFVAAYCQSPPVTANGAKWTLFRHQCMPGPPPIVFNKRDDGFP